MSERRSLIELFTPQLREMALISLLNQVCQRKVSLDAYSEQGDLFGAFGKIPRRVTVKTGSKKRTIDLSINEARKWLTDHETRLVKNDNEDFAKMVAECESRAQSGDESIGSILRRMHQEHIDGSNRKSAFGFEPAE